MLRIAWLRAFQVFVHGIATFQNGIDPPQCGIRDMKNMGCTLTQTHDIRREGRGNKRHREEERERKRARGRGE